MNPHSRPIYTDDLVSAGKTATKVMDSTNIWSAIGELTNSLGAKAGEHLETLLCRELSKAREEVQP